MFRKWLGRAALLLFAVEMAIPVGGLATFSLDNQGSFTRQAYMGLFSDGTLQGPLFNSLAISLSAALFCVAVVTPPLWYAYLKHGAMLRIIESASFLPFVLPAVVLGLAYVQFFSNPPLALAGTPDLLPFAAAMLGLPYYIQAVLNRLRLVDAKTYHEAAASLGSSPAQSWWRVQIPLLWPGVVNGAMLVFSIGMGEFTITQLTTGGSFMTLPIAVQVGFQNNPLTGAALAVVSLLIAVLALFLALGAAAGGRRRL